MQRSFILQSRLLTRTYILGQKGSGSYSSPLNFATAPGEYNQCELLYLPYPKKYIRFEDECAQCIKSLGKFLGENTVAFA